MEYLREMTDDEDFVEVILRPKIPRSFRERLNHFIKWNETEFHQRFRLSKGTVRNLLDDISLAIQSKTARNHALMPEDMLLLTLRFLATGSMLQVVGDFSGVDKSTASRTVHKVTRAIAELSNVYINMPSDEEDISKTRQGFFNICKFPRCIGAVDCTHIKIQSPGGHDPEYYRNRKGYFSFNVQAVCDSELRIRDIVCRWPGATHDSTIFKNSRLAIRLQNGEFGNNLLLGDSGYAIQRYLITPLRNPETPAEHLFNESQIRTRNPIERCFGVWKRRFPVLALGIKLNSNRVEAVVVACAVLHNKACLQRDLIPQVDEDIEAAIHLGNIQEVAHAPNNPGLNNIVRQSLINEYFQNLLR